MQDTYCMPTAADCIPKDASGSVHCCERCLKGFTVFAKQEGAANVRYGSFFVSRYYIFFSRKTTICNKCFFTFSDGVFLVIFLFFLKK